MARIVALEEVDSKLKDTLSRLLRLTDEGVMLPQCHVSSESKTIKNAVVRLSGSDESVNAQLFNPNWFSGVSIIKIPTEKAELLIKDPREREKTIRKLVQNIPSEMNDSQLHCGPDLECDSDDRDKNTWQFGFDGPGCCVGVYSALERRRTDAFLAGTSRAHISYFLVCKAGGGVATQTFHSRLTAALTEGATLEEALSEGGTPGAAALRRISTASKRNRARILAAAAEAVGLYSVNTIGDNASPVGKPYRLAIPDVEVCYNSLIRVQGGDRPVWQYSAGCVDASVSQGIAVSSNVTEGFIVFSSTNGDVGITFRNDAHNCLPFCTQRLKSNRDVVFSLVEAYKNKTKAHAHPDGAWVSNHFGWKPKVYSSSQPNIEPPCIWGSHDSENFISQWSRELGISKFNQLRLHPEAVAVSAMEPGKLRVVVKDLEKSN